ncbi:hypothetical protein KXD93_14455 [Mucilaginibacter sp. BJC16-A38]|nr:hypothetical protein [Mucilaginibacter phenanthrenivorans]
MSKTGFAQNQDSIARKVVAYAADKFPETRTFNFEFSSSGPYNFTSTLRGQALPAGRVTNWTQARASANINFIKSKNWILGTTFTYRLTSLTAALNEPVSGLTSSVKEDFQYHSSSLNLAYISKLFNKTTIYSSSVSIDGSEKKFERVRGLFAATMLLKADAQTKIGIGVVVNIDPSAQLPVLPVFTYEHHFDDGLVADIALPRNIFLRKRVFQNGRITVGTELDRTSFYLYNQDNTGRTFEFNQVDLNNGLIYEYRLWDYFILTMKGGLKTSLSPRIFDRNKSYNDPIFQAKTDPSAYFNVGLSFNPFAKKRR